ncbi:MAG: ABC transporter permease [Myxococcales bacterium]
MKKKRNGTLGAFLVALLVLFSLLGPLLATHNPLTSDFTHAVSPDQTPVGPSWSFPLGADRLFRDQFARLAHGARLSLCMALLATLLATFLGTTLGITTGFLAGSRTRTPWPLLLGALASLVLALAGNPLTAAVVLAAAIPLTWSVPWLQKGPAIDFDGLLMRAVDIGLAFPFLLLVMAIGAALDETTPTTVVLVLGLTGWLGTVRIVRSKTLEVRSREFVTASRALGQSPIGIILRHVLPNVFPVVWVLASSQVASMILAEAALSYLGVGLAPPTPTWGHMLFEGQDYLQTAPWMVLGPAAAILVSVLGFNLLGEALHDGLDPHL